MPRYKPKGVTPRRLAAQKRKLEKRKASMPLLADFIDQSSLPFEEVIIGQDAANIRYFEALRASSASDWRKARNQLRNHPAKHEILDRWNSSSCPGTGCYLLDMIRRWDKGH